jgi:hypothetical protein
MLTQIVACQLEGESLQAAAKEWVMYLRNYDEISPVYDKHQNSAGFLDKEGLKKVLCCALCVCVFVCKSKSTMQKLALAIRSTSVTPFTATVHTRNQTL